MSWAKFDDNYSDNQKIAEAGPMAELLDMRAIIYSARMETDGRILDSALPRLGYRIPKYRQQAARLVEVGRWLVHPDGGYEIHDFLAFNPSKAEKEAERVAARTRTEIYRTRGLADAIKNRDGDRCRYCGEEVNWKDRKSARGAVFEHVRPVCSGGETTMENLVVACRGCNAKKAGRTPEDAGMTLRVLSSYLDPVSRYVGTGREIEEKERAVPPTWVRLGMTRAAWMEAGRPEVESA